MMLGESQHRFHPTVQIPQWSDDPTATIYSPVNNVEPNSPYCIHEALTALQRYLPSNEPDPDFDPSLEPDAPVDAYSCDHFRMYEFKVRRCVRGRSHDWTECPYAHPGEKARRRDPRKYHYSGTACPDFRKGSCKKGDSCEFAHGVFECWLHPARYRTQPCKDGGNCKRRVCFFAHSADQLRVVNNSPDSLSSPLKAKTLSFSPPESPPESPMSQTRYLSRSLGSTSMNEMVASLRGLQLGKGKSVPSSWSVQMGGSPVFGSPRGGSGSGCRAGFCSLPSTPTQPNCYNRRGGFSGFDVFDSVCEEEEEPAMERVESGRDLRMKMLERLSKENALGRVERVDSDPDVGWVSDLLK